MSRRRPPRRRAGVVSVVLVNYRGAADTIECLRGFDQVEWPADRLELIVVDNGSGDGSAEAIRQAVPAAVVVASPENLGFAGGCNLGVDRAAGDYIGLINNDARPDTAWISAAVDVLETQPSVASVASKVLDWEGTTIDYVDGSLAWFGMGYKREVGQPDTGTHEAGTHEAGADVLFATGAAMFVRTDVWREVGGFDDRYFMFYEDVDLGWRLNLLGHRVRYEPRSVAYHRHHASMRGYGSWREHFLLERNALFTLYKNYDDDRLARVLPGALALAVRRGLARGDADHHALDLARAPVGDVSAVDEPERTDVSRETLAPAFAVADFVDHLPGLQADRRRVQDARRRTDAELLPLFRDAMEPAFADEGFLTGYRAVVDAFGITEAFGGRRRIVVATEEPLTAAMAGPAIRAWNIAAALGVEHEVELVTLRDCSMDHARFRCRSVTDDELRSLERWCDILVVGGMLTWVQPWIVRTKKVLVVDVYNPFHLEQLEQVADSEDRVGIVDECTSALNAQLSRGDLFLCASPKQRVFWLGQLAALGRINPATYDEDPTLDSLIAVAPFGLPDTPPVHTGPAMRGVVPGIGPDDRIILWGGGIYNWLDPLTLLHAVDRLRRRCPDVRLFFLGLRHPNPGVPEMRMAGAAQELSAELGLTDTHVFFNHGWVPYAERQNYLLEADIGVSTHRLHVETAFSFRTRILDYLWASLPVVATGGDAFAEIIAGEGAGLIVPPDDVGALAEALFCLLDDDTLAARCRRGAAAAATQLTWSASLEPLVQFCRAPRRAPDLLDGLGAPTRGADGASPVDLRRDLALLRGYLAEGGPSEVARRAYGRIGRLHLRSRP